MSTTKLNIDAIARKAQKEKDLEGKPLTLSDDDVPDPLNWQIILEVMEAPKKMGLIDIPDEAQETERIQRHIGIVRKLGPLAVQGKSDSGLDLAVDKDRVVPGAFVIFHRYTGLKMKVMTDSGHERLFIALAADDLVCVTAKPERLRFWL